MNQKWKDKRPVFSHGISGTGQYLEAVERETLSWSDLFPGDGPQLAAHYDQAGMVERARKYDGCLDLSISADSVDPDRINLFGCWRDQQSWNAWRKIAKPGQTRGNLGKAVSQRQGREAILRRSVGLIPWYLT